MGKIDDPIEASFGAWPAESTDMGQKAGELALTFSGLVFTPAKIAKILKDQFASPNRFARIEYLLNGIRLGIKNLETEKATDRARLKSVEEKLSTPQFSEAIAVACEEAARAASERKIGQLAAVLVGSLDHNRWADSNEDIAALIRDVGQLGEKDLKVLSILRHVHASAIEATPNLNNPDAFSRETGTLNTAIGVNGFSRDDFLSACEHLRGFGFAAEVLRNTSHMAPQDYCYRPTRRGLTVLDYLSQVPRDAEQRQKTK